MHAIINTFESGCGDCIVIRLQDGDAGEVFNIMIDCGVFTSQIKDFVINELDKRIDLLVVSHYDNDHVTGVVSMLRCREMENLTIGKIMYNCFQYYANERVIQIDAVDADILDGKLVNLDPVIDENFQKCGAVEAGLLCLNIKTNDNWYEAWHKQMIKAGDMIELGNPKWGRMHVLSPSVDALDDLKQYFIREYAKVVHCTPPEENFMDQEKYWEMLLRLASQRPSSKKKIPVAGFIFNNEYLRHCAKFKPIEDSLTPPNKAAIALIWECNDKRILLCGDAQAKQILTELELLYPEDAIVKCEAIKISHHGSKNNTTNELIKKIDSPHYFLTGGKKDEGPNIEALAKIIIRPLHEGITEHRIHYNKIERIEELKVLVADNSQELLASYNCVIDNNNESHFEY